MKKIILILITFHLSFFTPQYCGAQGIWTARAPLPDSARAYAIGFSIGNYGYVGLGTHNAHVNYPCLDDFWQFDPSTDSWTQKANFPGKARICPATFVIGNYAYVVTGQENDSLPPKYTSECWQYNALSDKWTQKANFPGSPRAYDVGFAIGGKGYVGIGSDYYNHYRKDFWEYDTTTNKWTQIADFGGIARLGSNGFAVDGQGYVCFGRDSSGKWHKDIWAYDTGTNKWTQKSNYPGYPMFGGSGFTIGTSIYVGTGEDSIPAFVNKFWQYNTLSDTWNEEASYPDVSRDVASAFSIGDTGYLGLGEDSASICFNSLYRFYPDSTMGIEELSNKATLSVYPNPFRDYCIVSLPNLPDNSPEIALYNLQGEKQNTMISYSYPNYIVNRGNLPSGIYVLSVKYNHQILCYKLIITN